MLCVLVLAVCAAVGGRELLAQETSVVAADLERLEELFGQHVERHHLRWDSPDEERRRLQVFSDNVKYIIETNKQRGNNNFGLTPFTHLTSEEFLANYTGLMASPLGNGACPQLGDTAVPAGAVPPQWDWRQRGVVSPIKNQLGCGSCWAFSTTGNLESQYAMKYGQHVQLSEQQLVDCAVGSNGCVSGYIDMAMTQIIQDGGINSEQDYPYMYRQGSCRKNPQRFVARLQSCNTYSLSNEEKLKQLLYHNGPLSIGIYCNPIQHFHGQEIFSHCPVATPNHAVLLVGYGSENGVDYWVIKNSWGYNWGDRGFIRLARGHNTCGLLNPVVTAAAVA